MFDLGIQELIVIFIVALIIFGPKRLPEIGKTLGKGLGELKRSMQGVKEQMDTELRDIKQPVSFDTALDPGRKTSAAGAAEEKIHPYAADASAGTQAPLPAGGPESRSEPSPPDRSASIDTQTGKEQGLKG